MPMDSKRLNTPDATDAAPLNEGGSRRSFERKQCRLPVRYISKGTLYRGKITDISCSGMRISARHNVSEGQDIVLFLPHLKDEPFLEVVGRVVWSSPDSFGLMLLSRRKERMPRKETEKPHPGGVPGPEKVLRALRSLRLDWTQTA